MQINWKIRFKNAPWIIGFVGAIVAFIYQMLGMFEIVPAIGQDDITQVVGLVVNILIAMGILVDPTTKGMSDSDRAMAYDKPGGPSLPDDGYDWSNKATDRRGL